MSARAPIETLLKRRNALAIMVSALMFLPTAGGDARGVAVRSVYAILVSDRPACDIMPAELVDRDLVQGPAVV